MSLRDTPGTPHPRAAIDCRLAALDQRSGTARLDAQAAACRACAAAHGLAVSDAHVYQEIAAGTPTAARPALDQILAAIQREDVTVIITPTLDRLSRDQRHLEQLLATIARAGGRVLCTAGGTLW